LNKTKKVRRGEENKRGRRDVRIEEYEGRKGRRVDKVGKGEEEKMKNKKRLGK
jgi:hypothetical protein